MKILLTGAAGFTGRSFSARAEAAGHTVCSLDADLTDKAALTAEVAAVRPSVVLHLGAISFVGHGDETAFYTVNVMGTLNLLAALATLKVMPSRVLLASSANVYGNCNCQNGPIDETQVPAPLNHYATSKLAMEHMALTYADRLPIVIARPFNYTGPGQAEKFLIPKLVSHFCRRANQIDLGNLHVEREFNDVRMVSEAYLRLLIHGKPRQVYNVCSGRPYALKQVITVLERITGHTLEVKTNPAYVRVNEIHRLYGSPEKLWAAIGPLEQCGLEHTLRCMLSADADR